MDINRCNAKAHIIGRVLRDPELKRFKGRNVCIFTVVVNTGRKNPDGTSDQVNFYDCSLWGSKATDWYNSLTKGAIVEASGAFYQHEYKTEAGDVKHRLRLEVSTMKMIASAKEAA